MHHAEQQQPQAVAVRDGGLVRTFAQLHDRAARPAGVLQALGAAPGDRVGMLAATPELGALAHAVTAVAEGLAVVTAWQQVQHAVSGLACVARSAAVVHRHV